MKVDWNEMTLQEKKAGMQHPTIWLWIIFPFTTSIEITSTAIFKMYGADRLLLQLGGLLLGRTALEPDLCLANGLRFGSTRHSVWVPPVPFSSSSIHLLDRHQRV